MKIKINNHKKEAEVNGFSFKQFSKIVKHFNGYRRYFMDSKISDIIHLYEKNFNYKIDKIMIKQVRPNMSGVLFFSLNDFK